MAKKLFYLIFFTMCFGISFSQTKTIPNVNILNLKNSGTIVNDNKVFHYIFYVVDDKKGGGVLTFLDENLAEVKQLTFALDKNNELLEVKDNGSEVITSFYSKEKTSITFSVYNGVGELKETKELSYPKTVFMPFIYKTAEQIGEWLLTYPVENKGFLISEIIKKKRFGYDLHYMTDDKSKNWTYQSPADHNNRKSASPLFANQELVVLLEKEWGSNYDKQPTFKAIILDTNTGKELFTVSHQYETKSNFYTNATVTKNEEIILFGEKYELGNAYPDNDYNTGYFMEKYSKSGQLIASSELAFDNEKFKKAIGFNDGLKQKEFGTVFINKVFEKNGKVYAIGELAKREKQGFTAAGAVTAFAFGSLGTQKWSSVYNLENLFSIEFDENCNYITTQKLEKEASVGGLNSMVVRPYFNLKHMEYDGTLDYLFSTKNDASNLLSFFYLNQKTTDKTIKYSIKKGDLHNGIITTNDYSDITLNATEKYFKVVPRNTENVLLIKFDYEKKSLGLEVLKKK